MHLVQVWQFQLLWQPNSGHSIAAGIPAGLLQFIPAQCVADRVGACRFRQCDQRLCLHSKQGLRSRACLSYADCRCTLTMICAAPICSARVHPQGCPEHSARASSAWLCVRRPYTEFDPCQCAGVFRCLKAVLVEVMPMLSSLSSVERLSGRAGCQTRPAACGSASVPDSHARVLMPSALRRWRSCSRLCPCWTV